MKNLKTFNLFISENKITNFLTAAAITAGMALCYLAYNLKSNNELVTRTLSKTVANKFEVYEQELGYKPHIIKTDEIAILSIDRIGRNYGPKVKRNVTIFNPNLKSIWIKFGENSEYGPSIRTIYPYTYEVENSIRYDLTTPDEETENYKLFLNLPKVNAILLIKNSKNNTTLYNPMLLNDETFAIFKLNSLQYQEFLVPIKIKN
jgi:hypothetical protein